MEKLLIIVISISLFSCSPIFKEKEIGRLPINKVSLSDTMQIVKSISLQLKKNDVIGIWVDMDIEFNNDLGLEFLVEVFKDSIYQGDFRINPFDTHATFHESEIKWMGKTKWSCEGRTGHCDITSDANYIFKGWLFSSKNPTLIIRKAEVILKKVPNSDKS